MRRAATLRRVAALALAGALPALAYGAELPRRKSGLWEMSTKSQHGQVVAATMCVDRKSDDLSRQLAAAGVSCSKQQVRRQANGYVFDSVCRFGESTATSRAVFSGSFDSQYDVDITAKYSPPLFGMSEGRSTIRARWIGPCKAGQRPGDLIMPNGTTINMQNAPKDSTKR